MAGNYVVKDQLHQRLDLDYVLISSIIEKSLKQANQKEHTYTENQLEDILSWMTPEKMESKLKDSYGVIYSDGGQVLGFGFLAHRRGRWEIAGMYVDLSVQGKGIGKEIYKMLEEKAFVEGIEKIHIVSYDFQSTLAFYERNGFMRSGELNQSGTKFKIIDLVKEIAKNE